MAKGKAQSVEPNIADMVNGGAGGNRPDAKLLCQDKPPRLTVFSSLFDGPWFLPTLIFYIRDGG